jgi:hypothetical protein
MSNIGSITFGLTGGPSGSYNINTASTSSTLNISASSNLTLDASTNVIIDASSVIIDASNNVTIDASNNVTIDASGIILDASGSITLNGPTTISNSLNVGGNASITNGGAITGISLSAGSGAISGGAISGSSLSVGTISSNTGLNINSSGSTGGLILQWGGVQYGNIIGDNLGDMAIIASGVLNINCPESMNITSTNSTGGLNLYWGSTKYGNIIGDNLGDMAITSSSNLSLLATGDINLFAPTYTPYSTVTNAEGVCPLFNCYLLGSYTNNQNIPGLTLDTNATYAVMSYGSGTAYLTITVVDGSGSLTTFAANPGGSGNLPYIDGTNGNITAFTPGITATIIIMRIQ